MQSRYRYEIKDKRLMLREMVNAMPGEASISGFSYKLNVNIHYQIGPDLAAEVFGSYRSRRIEFQDTHPAFLFYTAAVKKQFRAKKLSLGITLSYKFGRSETKKKEEEENPPVPAL